MVNLPTEWQNNNGNLNGSKQRADMNKNVNKTEIGLTKFGLVDPVISISDVNSSKKSVLTNDFKYSIDEDFKRRSSQLTDGNFKDMPRIIKVKNCEITTHFVPGFTKTQNNLNLKPREFEQIRKKNEFGFDRTATKEIKINKINPEEVTNKSEQRNKFNYVTFEARESCGRTPIVPVEQERKKLIIKQ